MKTQNRLIRLMSDGHFHSGEGLAESLGISRAAVWKRLKGLAAHLGLEVQAVPGKGYRLLGALELLDRELVLGRLRPEARARVASLDIHDRIDSTNTWMMQQAMMGAPSGSFCLAEVQTAGKGRRGRQWVSPFGTNIYLSLLWHFPLAPPQLSGLSLAAGLATLRALRLSGAQDIQVKWPNDVVWSERKLAGILLELRAESGGPSQVVLGVGVNTRLPASAAEEIDQPWVDLETVLGGARTSRNHLATLLIEALSAAMEAFGEQGFAPLADEWNRYDAYRGCPVGLSSGERRSEGIHRGVDSTGALLLEREGQVTTHHAGELSLRLRR